jgi:DNA mismatch repair protein MutS2
MGGTFRGTRMDAHTLRLLEFDKIVASIASGAVLEATREAAAEMLAPLVDPVRIAQRRDTIAEIMALVRNDLSFDIADLTDPREFLNRAHIEGSMLTAAELAQVAQLLRNAAGIKRFFKTHHADAPLAGGLAGQLVSLPEVLKDLNRAISEDGLVSDDASPELRRLRRTIRSTYGSIEKRLLKLLRNPDLRDSFSGDRPTQRNGRLVLPMKNNRWTSVGGLVQDRSHTGQTFFVEPAATIELGNELQNLAAKEEAEVRRVLRALTGRLRPHLDDLRDSFGVLIRIDLWRAAAGMGHRCNMVPAEMVDADRPLELVAAWHPLLESTLAAEGRTDDLVPLSIRIDPTLRVLAVTGSNTGGKTVALKTLGLLALMAQAGLPVPAQRAALPIFDRVLVDIGDEQSIEQSLSTFSGHMAQIVNVLRGATDRSLVLLDELGSGTDPAEGGALACAIIKSLASRRATAVLTTHLREVKIFCHEHDGMQNAAMEFNAETLRPTYRLVQGEPGQSHAVTIAQRLGLPSEVIDHARGFLTDEHLNLESLLSKMAEERRRLRDELAQAGRDREQAAEQRRQLEADLAESKAERKTLLRRAYQEAAGIVDNTRREMQQVVREAREQTGDAADVETLRQKVSSKRQRLSEGSRHTTERSRPKVPSEELRQGLAVYVEPMRANGTIESVNRNKRRASVNIRGLSVDVRLDDLSLAEAAAPGARRSPQTEISRAETMASMELNLIGQRVHEAVAQLDHFLNQACLSDVGLLHIIHGRGTGALMRAVHEYLKEHPLVASFRSGNETEGGIAVTVVKLKE